ncbi:hypothetical protein JCM6882_001960 [Rhodosporidiobolus microsporus]
MPPRRRNTQGDDSNGSGQVYGPRSALTSFLREQGITGPGANVSYINRRQGTLQRSPSQQDDGTASPSTSADDGTTTVTPTLASGSTSDADTNGVTVNAAASSSRAAASSSTDANAEAGPSSGSSKRKGKPLTAAQAKKKKAAQAAEFGDDGDFTLGGGAMPAPKKGRYEDRTPGAIKVCGECGKKFTVSKYTASNPHGPGLLCAPCTSESIEDRATFPSAGPKGKKAAPKKKKAEKAVDETKWTPVPTLQQGCLSIIASFISSVEPGAFSYLGAKNLDRVAKIVCKNRALDGENMKLFLEVGHRELKLYDCTNITDSSLSLIPTFSPHLVSLTLLQCGRLDDDTLTAWQPRFKELKHLELYAPYLVSAKKWVEWFAQRKEEGIQAEGGLETFRLRMSARFNDLSLRSLVTHNPNLTSLQLSEIGQLTGESLKLLYPLGAGGQLQRLDISRLGMPQGQVLEDEDVVGLLKEVGKGLKELVLDGNVNLTSTVLTSGIIPHCHALTSLSLANLSLIDADGFTALFSPFVPPTAPAAAEDEPEPETEGASPPAPVPTAVWSPAGLTHLNAHRLHDALTPETFALLLAHSGKALQHLNLHSCDLLLPESVGALADKAPELEVLDVSFVRAMDNFVVKQLLEGVCGKLRVVFVHGNNRVTSDVPRKAGVQIRGLENAVHSEIPGGMVWEA